MNTQRVNPEFLPQPRGRRASLLAACLVTVFASNARAIDIPVVPLQSGAAYPPANVMFILDDSGSMEFYTMPHDVSHRRDNFGSNREVRDGVDDTLLDRFYGKNTMFYNPATTYQPWIKSDNTRYTTGLSYTSAWDDASLLTTAINLSSKAETFFVPKPATTDFTNIANFYHYTINTGGTSITRAEYVDLAGITSTVPAGYPKTLSATTGGLGPIQSFVVPANTRRLRVSTAGGTHGDNGGVNNNVGDGPNLYLDTDNTITPTDDNGDYICQSTSNNNTDVCEIDFPAAGTWYAALNRASSFNNVVLTVQFQSSASCDGAMSGVRWGSCTSTLPNATRSLSQELTNFATWYSYHSSRMKVAKGGGSEAFSQLGANLRIGFDTIWNRGPTDTDSTPGTTPALPIPVATSNGVFTGANKDTWFTRLHDAVGSDGTPLKGALHRAGEYFSDNSATGPWGPQTGANQISCRQNFAILTTDGFWNSNAGYVADTPDTTDNNNLLGPIGDSDGTAGPTITNTNGDTFTYATVKPYIDNFATTPNTQPNTLGDVAMHYWKRDLVTTLENNVPTSSDDPGFWQHMVTFSVSIGLGGNLNPAIDLPSITNGSKRWGDPSNAQDADRIDDLWHASVNGRGSFIVASNTREFQRGLLDAFAQVAQRLGSASNVTANSTSFSSDTRVFQASYVTGKWIGELAAFDATSAGVATLPTWKASVRLAADLSRDFFTWDPTLNSGLGGGATFPTVAQSLLLDQSTRSGSPATSVQNVAYLKGDQSLERAVGGLLRDRDSRLGDVVNSSPFYSRGTDTLFVGSNDGMLHAFNASTGNELFAFVPGSIDIAGLGSLSDPYYTHKYFVDGPVVVSTTSQTPGKNYLVGSLGRGGKSLFGLDVTAPTTFNATKVLWQRSDIDLGLVFGEPLIVTLNDVGNTKAVVVGNGFNSTGGKAVLFVINIATGAIIQKIDTLVGGDNGLSAPRGWDNDGNGTVDYVYSGDRLGNMWKFDFTGATATIGFSGNPMFTTATGQPITTGLALAKDPATNKRWAFFGTGSFIATGDPADTTIQSIYGVIDEGTTTVPIADLMVRDIVVSTTVAGRALRSFEPATTLPAGKKGWLVDLDTPTNGERVTSRPQIRGSVLIFASIIPPTNNTCDAGGSGFINAIDAFSGTSTGQPFFDSNGDGVVNSSDTLTFQGNPIPVGSVDLGVGMPTLPTVIEELLVVGGSEGELGSITINPQGGVARRASWYEILGD